MPEQTPEVRARNFVEVPLGYTPEMAKDEASRCLQCKNPGCVEGCPVGVDIPGFIHLIHEGDLTQAIRHLWGKNSLPAVCGRVCPQEIQCEGLCILAKKGEAGGHRQPGALCRGLGAGPRHRGTAPQGSAHRQAGGRGRCPARPG